MTTIRILLLLLICGVYFTASSAYASSVESNYGPIHFQSAKVANWQLKSRFRPHSITETHYYDSSFTYPAGSQTLVSAKRTFNTRLPQQVYATYNTNNTAFRHYAEWLYLPTDIGTFTRLGWLLGDNKGLNMAVELEHRQVGEEENMGLSLGVHYFF
ncbi:MULTISPECIES: hypothetical protein [Alteromonas]|jgi:hypothetical protein|uniref:DUF3575 domain-containing protein n=1 Tax=Alteromonas hispanica TaxID=315421 RepID=A0A6L9MTZ1_9ALTE|nr:MULTISPECIES: hypothetical protein [Alteromonas]AUC87444.1 hypothetical protein CW735_03905 [Alteromonas sp. MB-3u-76]MAI65748.1 hypothetical protein [Alteromonas sp.]NDW21732.1 hypothetical protein [Alteromonas hispanica]